MPLCNRDAFANLCDQVTKGIIQDIHQRRTSHWLVPWANGGFPVNAYTNRPYLGELNVLILSCAETEGGYQTPRWLTARQAWKMGGEVKSGARPTTVLFGRGADATGSSYGRLIQLFNVDQCTDLASPPLPPREVLVSFPRLERLIAASGVDFRVGGRRGFYQRAEDYVQVPPPSRYFHAGGWTRTVVHELAHATQHPARQDRKPLDDVKHVAAAREELLAELATAFVLARMRLYSSPASPSYIKAWLRYAKVESDYLLQLQPQAQAIAEYLLAFDR